MLPPLHDEPLTPVPVWRPCLSRMCFTAVREIKLETSVTDYFHADGYLAEAKYKHHVAKLLGQYERLDASSDPRPKALNPGKQD